MNIRWQKLLVKLTVWLALEVVLNLMGLDDMADYGEFVFDYGNNSPFVTTFVNCVIV